MFFTSGMNPKNYDILGFDEINHYLSAIRNENRKLNFYWIKEVEKLYISALGFRESMTSTSRNHDSAVLAMDLILT